jgi:hypothetical protein
VRSTSLLRRGLRPAAFLGVGLVVFGITAGGCKKNSDKEPAPVTLAPDSNTAGARAGKAISGLTQTQQELNTAKANVKSVIASLQGLKASTGAGMGPAYKEFKTQATAMEAHATKVAAQAQDMQARGGEYRQYWQNEVSKMENPELRTGAQERAAKVAARFDEIRGKFEGCRQAYQPFKKGVNDIESYLDKELSSSSLSLTQGAIDKAITDGNKLNKAIDEAIVELVSVSVKMASEAK